METRARVLVIGAGIVGSSVAYHLAELGETDVLVVDRGPLFATGGSSSHAPGLVFQTNPARTMTQLAAATVRRYGADGCFHAVGGIEVAATAPRWADLKRKRGIATAWGVEAELIGPAEVVARIPHLDAAHIHGGLWVASDGIADPVRAAEAMARSAAARGVRFAGHTEVTGFAFDGGRIVAVDTDTGRIEVETVLCCAGIWGPSVGALAGVSVPVQALAHQYALSTPVAGFGPAQPILRHQDSAMYFRQMGDRYGIGSYQHRAIPVTQRQLAAPAPGGPDPSGSRWAGMRSVQPFTPDDFEKPWSDARDLLPVLRDAEVAEAMNGLFLFTADGMPVLGPSPEVPNFWTAEAVWITHAGGVGRAMAEWLVAGEPGTDLRAADIRRFDRHAHSPAYVAARSAQNFREVYDIVHPQQPPAEPRPLRTSPYHLRQEALGAVFLEASGWERAHWYRSTTPRDLPAPGEWAGRYHAQQVAAEHQITREAGGIFDMTPLTRVEVSGPAALGLLRRLTTGALDREPGYVTYALMLDARGGIRSDVTIARLSATRFQVGCNGARDVAWIADHAEGHVTVRDVTGGTCCLGLWGPRARDVLAPLADADVSHAAFRPFRARELHVGEVPVLAMRLSYAGELGWELSTSADYGLRLWDLLVHAGARHGVRPAGRGALAGLRIEKGYRAWGTDMWSEHDPDEAGLGFAVATGAGDHLGRTALERRREQAPRRRLVGLRIEDGTVVLGSEPVGPPGGRAAGFVTSAAYGYTVGASLAYAWVPAALAAEGTPVEVTISTSGTRRWSSPPPCSIPARSACVRRYADQRDTEHS